MSCSQGICPTGGWKCRVKCKIYFASNCMECSDLWGLSAKRIFILLGIERKCHSAQESHLDTLNSAYNEKKYVEIFLCYEQLFIKGDIIIGELEIFGAEVFLRYSQFFIKGKFVIDGVECNSPACRLGWRVGVKKFGLGN